MLTQTQRNSLVSTATSIRKNAHAPYSGYAVGAAVLTENGNVYDGVNIENASYPLTNCAERTAIFKAVTAGEKKFTAVAVVTDNGGTPCGACRQVMAEFGLDTIVIIAKSSGEIVREMTVDELLPGAFTPENLPR